MGLAGRENENNRWEFERNGNETWLNLGAGIGMGMSSWERDGMGLQKTFPHAHL